MHAPMLGQAGAMICLILRAFLLENRDAFLVGRLCQLPATPTIVPDTLWPLMAIEIAYLDLPP